MIKKRRTPNYAKLKKINASDSRFISNLFSYQGNYPQGTVAAEFIKKAREGKKLEITEKDLSRISAWNMHYVLEGAVKEGLLIKDGDKYRLARKFSERIIKASKGTNRGE